MTRTLLRAGALSCALLTSTALTTPAQAQLAREHRAVDGNGVDLTHGDFVMSLVEGVIGAGDGALALVRTGAWSSGHNGHQWDGITFTRLVTGTTTTGFAVTVGSRVERFPATGGTLPSGSTLSGDANSFTYRRSDGTTIAFSDGGHGGYGSDSNFCTGDPAQPGCTLIPTAVATPDGRTVSLDWDISPNCWDVVDSEHLPCHFEARLGSVTNSFGYQIRFAYSTDDSPGSSAWSQRTGATFHNMGVSGNPAQSSVSYAYPSAGVTQVTDMGGRVWRIAASGAQVTAIRRPGASSDTTTIGYDGNGAVNAVTRDGVATAYARSVSGSTATTVVTDALSHQATAVSNLALGRLTSLTDPLSHTTSYQYDSDGRLTRVTAPEGDYTAITYDARGNVTEQRQVAKSGSGLADIVATASYDSSCTNPVTCNRPNSVTDARGNTTDFTYDPDHGGVLTETRPAPATGLTRPQTRYGYTATNGVIRLTAVSTCASGRAVDENEETDEETCVGTGAESRAVLTYDDSGNVTSVQQRDGIGMLSATTATTYDARGDVVSVDGPLSGTADTTIFRYNAARQRVGAISPDPDGAGSLPRRAVRTTYSSTTGLPTSQEIGTVAGTSDTDWSAFSAAQGQTVEYDADARPVVQRLVSGSTTYALTQASYDALGRPRCTAVRMNPSEFATSSLPSDACTLDTEGSYGPDRIARTSYDDAGRVVKLETGVGVTGVAADEVAATFTANGRQETLTDGEGNRTTFVYDGRDRVVRMRYPSTTQGAGTSSTTDYEELGYDAAGNVTSLRLRDGNSIGYSYDALNRVIAKDLPGSEPDVSYAYDLLGRLTSVGTASHTLAFTYDALGRPLSQADNLYGTTSQTYDLAGRRTSLTYPILGFTVNYSHLATGELHQILSGTSAAFTFGYDGLGRRTSITRYNGVSTSYGYDAAGRLSSLAHDLTGTADDVTFDYTYNPAGQIVGRTVSNDAYSFTGLANQNVTDTHNGLNQVTATGSTSMSHDTRGNTSAIGSASYSYTAENHIASGGSGTFAHDPLGRMVTSSASTTDFARGMAGELLVERTTGGSAKAYYANGEGLNEPLLSYDSSGGRYLLSDERGSIIATTDTSGNLSAINRYDEYGQPQDGSITGRFGYTGQAWLPELSMYDYHARVYNPGLGRFMQADPIGYAAGMTLYRYAANDPVNLTDPLGLQEVCWNVSVDSEHGDNITVGHDRVCVNLGDVFGYLGLTGDATSLYNVGSSGQCGSIGEIFSEIARTFTGGTITARVPSTPTTATTRSPPAPVGRVGGVLGLPLLLGGDTPQPNTPIYRSVGPRELASIRQNSGYSPGGLEVKEFWLDLGSAQTYASMILARGWSTTQTIVSSRISITTESQGTEIILDGLPAIYFPNAVIPQINRDAAASGGIQEVQTMTCGG